MEIYDYVTDGGKNVIIDYIDGLPKAGLFCIYVKSKKGKRRNRKLSWRFKEQGVPDYYKWGENYVGKKRWVERKKDC